MGHHASRPPVCLHRPGMGPGGRWRRSGRRRLPAGRLVVHPRRAPRAAGRHALGRGAVRHLAARLPGAAGSPHRARCAPVVVSAPRGGAIARHGRGVPARPAGSPGVQPAPPRARVHLVRLDGCSLRGPLCRGAAAAGPRPRPPPPHAGAPVGPARGRRRHPGLQPALPGRGGHRGSGPGGGCPRPAEPLVPGPVARRCGPDALCGGRGPAGRQPRR